MNWHYLPNAITLMRIALVIPVIWALQQGAFGWALCLFAIAGVSDGLDGFLAKQFQWQSRLGSILDPLADKLLLVACFVMLTWLQLLPAWLLLAVFARDVIIVLGAVLYHWRFGAYALEPLWSSKINTCLQIGLVLLVIMAQHWQWAVEPLITIGIWLVLASVINSGSEYVLVWGQRAYRQIRGRSP